MMSTEKRVPQTTTNVPVATEPLAGGWTTRFRRVSWGAIFAGFFSALGVQLLLSLLGLAIGFWSIDPMSEEFPLSGLGVGASVWWVVTGIIALFVGGCIAGRMSGYLNPTDGLLQGVVVWGLLAVVGFWTAGSAFGTLFSATTSALSASLEVVGEGVNAIGSNAFANAQQSAAATSQNGAHQDGSVTFMRPPAINFETLGEELRKVLRETGKEELSPESLQERAEAIQMAARDAAKTVLKRPDSAEQQIDRVLNEFYTQADEVRDAVDREAVINVLTANTDLTEAEARKIANRWQDEFEEATQVAQQTQEDLESEMEQLGATISKETQEMKQAALETSEEALDSIASAAFWCFLTLLFGLGAAAGGGFLGASATNRQVA